MSKAGRVRPNVGEREIDIWVQAVVTYHDTRRADYGGGLAPRVIKDLTDTDRSIETITRHLRRDERVVERSGVARDYGATRPSFEPRGDLA